MIDEIFDRTYQQGRADLNDGLERSFRSIANKVGHTLNVLHDLQWSAPWDSKVRASKDAGCA